MTHRIAILLVVLAVVVAACNSGSTGETTSAGGASSGAQVGPDGGTVTSADGLFAVVIPEGALAENKEISIEPVPPEDLGLEGVVLAGAIYSIEPDGLQFNAPVTTVRTLSAAELGIGEGEVPFIYVFHGNEEQYEVASSVTSRDGDAVTVEADITHFTWMHAHTSDEIFRDRSLEVHLRLRPSYFAAPTGESRTITAVIEEDPGVDASAGGLFGRRHSGALASFEQAGRWKGLATCGETPGRGEYIVIVSGDATDESPAGLFFQGLAFLGGTLLEDDFTVAARGTADCTEPKPEEQTATGEGGGAAETAGPPDGSHFVEVTEGSAAGGNVFKEDGSHVGPNSGTMPLFFVQPAIQSPQALVVVPNPPLLDDGTPAVGIELYQSDDQRQGCGEGLAITFITGLVSGLNSNGEFAGCLQLYDPTQPATIFIYGVTGDEIADHSLVIEPNTLPGVGSIDFQNGIGSLVPPEGPPFAIPNDLDGDGDSDLHDWVTGNNLGTQQDQQPLGPPPFLITDMTGAIDGDALLINFDLDAPFDPAAGVFSAELAFRLDVEDDVSLVGGPQFGEGTLHVGGICLPVPEDCSPFEVEVVPSDDPTQWTVRLVLPPEVSFDPATARMSGSAFYSETADSPSLFQQFPQTGSVPWQR